MKKRKNSGRRRWLSNKVRQSIRRTKLILGIPTTPQDWRGFAAEDKAECALEYLKKEKLIREYRRTMRLSSEDLDGKDFIVELLNGEAMAIDVKNHRWYQRDEEECRQKDIWLLTIWPSDAEEIARKKILALIISAYLLGQDIKTVRAIISTTIQGIPESPRGTFDRVRAFLQKIRK